MKRIKWAFGLSVLALSLVSSGCAKKPSEAEAQLAETQKQLDEANRKLEGAGMKPVPATPPEVAVAPAVPSRSAERAAAKKRAGSNVDGDTRNSALETGKPGWGDNKSAAARPSTHTMPAGTPIAVRTTSTISSKTSASGSTFEATLHQPLEVDGYLVAPRGATVEGVVLDSDPGGRVKGVASITLGLRRIVLADGSSLAISTDTRGAVANKSKGKDAMKVGIASGIGAAIGAIAGGGKGAAIGAGAGAAGGTGVVLATKGSAATIAAESVLTFKLSAPVSVRNLKQ